jgi:hypothetical protein
MLLRRASQWANHFEVTNLNKDKGPGDAYTYDLEWSPDAIKPPINQKVKGVPPAYIECGLFPGIPPDLSTHLCCCLPDPLCQPTDLA